jgi:hypothetical protein
MSRIALKLANFFLIMEIGICEMLRAYRSNGLTKHVEGADSYAYLVAAVRNRVASFQVA